MFRPKIAYAVTVAATLAAGALAVAGLGFSGAHVAELPAKSADAPVQGNSGDRPMDQSGLLRWMK